MLWRSETLRIKDSFSITLKMGCVYFDPVILQGGRRFPRKPDFLPSNSRPRWKNSHRRWKSAKVVPRCKCHTRWNSIACGDISARSNTACHTRWKGVPAGLPHTMKGMLRPPLKYSAVIILRAGIITAGYIRADHEGSRFMWENPKSLNLKKK